MKYETTGPEGTFVLAYHTPSEWADKTRERLLSLGCSLEYANKRAKWYARGK